MSVSEPTPESVPQTTTPAPEVVSAPVEPTPAPEAPVEATPVVEAAPEVAPVNPPATSDTSSAEATSPPSDTPAPQKLDVVEGTKVDGTLTTCPVCGHEYIVGTPRY